MQIHAQKINKTHSDERKVKRKSKQSHKNLFSRFSTAALFRFNGPLSSFSGLQQLRLPSTCSLFISDFTPRSRSMHVSRHKLACPAQEVLFGFLSKQSCSPQPISFWGSTFKDGLKSDWNRAEDEPVQREKRRPHEHPSETVDVNIKYEWALLQMTFRSWRDQSWPPKMFLFLLCHFLSLTKMK